MTPECFGPYLRYAITTKFRNFENVYKYDESQKFKLLLLVEFKAGVSWNNFLDAMNAGNGQDKFAVVLGWKTSLENNSRYATVHCKKAAVESDGWAIWDEYASRVELSLPMQEAEPTRAPAHQFHLTHHRKPQKVLIGVLDDGCPFAADRFLVTNPALGTRV